MDELLTVAQVAEMLGVNQMIVRSWISAGTLDSIRLGERRLRMERSALEDVIESERRL